MVCVLCDGVPGILLHCALEVLNYNHHVVNTTLLRDSWCLSTDLINILYSIWRPGYKCYFVHDMIPVGTLCHYETE